MIVETHSKVNKIVESASDLINTVILRINEPVHPRQGLTYDAVWAYKFRAISNLNVISPDGNNYLSHRMENVDRYPTAMFYIDEVINEPDTSENTFTASLMLELAVEAESAMIGHHELYEMNHVCRALLLADKQLCVIPRGILSPVRQITGNIRYDSINAVGAGTSFTSEISPGDWISANNNVQDFGIVEDVIDDENIRLTEPYPGVNGVFLESSIVSYQKRGAIIDVIKWRGFELTEPEAAQSGAFLGLLSNFQVWYSEDAYDVERI